MDRCKKLAILDRDKYLALLQQEKASVEGNEYRIKSVYLFAVLDITKT